MTHSLDLSKMKTFRELYEEERFSDVKWKSKTSRVPREMLEYYVSHYEEYKGLAMNAKTMKRIAKILDEKGGG